MSKKQDRPYSESIRKSWDDFFAETQGHIASNSELLMLKGFTVVSMAIAFVADELADIKKVLSQKGDK